MRRALLTPSCILVAVLLAGCAVGPNFNAPVAPDGASYDAGAAETTADGAQNIQGGQDIPAQWWKLFHSDDLNKLVEQAIKNNPDIASAEAALRVADDNLSAGSADLFPAITGSFSSQREKTSKAANNGFAPSFTYTLHNASVGVSYGLDVFGGTRRAIEGLQAQADAARFQKEAVTLTLTANVITAAVQDASLREQLVDARAMVSDEEKILKIVEARFAAGSVAKSAVVAQQAQVASLRATVPPLEHQRSVNKHALAALIGETPAHAPQIEFSLASLTLPPEVPLTLPAQLVEQRPDIKAAQEDLHAASAAIGVAEAERLPKITLSADIGSMANVFNKLLTPGGGFWSLGGSAAETLFDAGALADKEDAARDAFDGSAAQYRKTVLAAFEDVADTLHALQADAEVLNAKTDANQAAAETLALTQAQFDAGAVDAATLLTAEHNHRQAARDLTQAKAQRYADTAALFTALGGGWANREKEADHD